MNDEFDNARTDREMLDRLNKLDPRTLYQIEKERRQTRASEMTSKQLREAKAIMDEGKEQRSGRRKK